MLWLFLVLPHIIHAQIPCGTPDISSEKEAAQQEVIQQLRLTHPANQQSALTITYLAIKPQIARTSAGTGGLSLTALNDALAEWMDEKPCQNKQNRCVSGLSDLNVWVK